MKKVFLGLGIVLGTMAFAQTTNNGGIRSKVVVTFLQLQKGTSAILNTNLALTEVYS